MSTPLIAGELDAAVHTGCVLFERGAMGRLWAQGRDRLDLLHRMSTNDLTGMPLNTVRQTVLTNHLGRIVDRLDVLNLPDGALLLTSPDQAGAVRAWLARHVFFQDDVQLRDTTAEMDQLLLLGGAAAKIADALFAGAGALSLQQLLQVDAVIVARIDAYGHAGFEIIAPADAINVVRARAVAAGALPAPPALLHLLRVEAGTAGNNAARCVRRQQLRARQKLRLGLKPHKRLGQPAPAFHARNNFLTNVAALAEADCSPQSNFQWDIRRADFRTRTSSARLHTQ